MSWRSSFPTANVLSFQFVTKIGPHGMVGEIGVMFNIPQPFTIRSRTLTQVIRISHGHLLHTVRPDTADGETIFTNFVKVCYALSYHVSFRNKNVAIMITWCTITRFSKLGITYFSAVPRFSEGTNGRSNICPRFPRQHNPVA